MISLKNFKIRKTNSHEWVTSYKAVFELIKQRALVIKNELWFDYNYGLDLTNLNEQTLYFWLRDLVEDIKYIKEVRNLTITRNKEKREYNIYIKLEFSDNEIQESEFNLEF